MLFPRVGHVQWHINITGKVAEGILCRAGLPVPKREEGPDVLVLFNRNSPVIQRLLRSGKRPTSVSSDGTSLHIHVQQLVDRPVTLNKDGVVSIAGNLQHQTLAGLKAVMGADHDRSAPWKHASHDQELFLRTRKGVFAIDAVPLNWDGEWVPCDPGELLPFTTCDAAGNGTAIDVATLEGAYKPARRRVCTVDREVRLDPMGHDAELLQLSSRQHHLAFDGRKTRHGIVPVEVTEWESALATASAKVGTLSGYMDHVVCFLQHFDKLNAFYSTRSQLDRRLYTHCARQSAMQRLCNQLLPTRDHVLVIGGGFVNRWGERGARRGGCAPAVRALVEFIARVRRVVIVNEAYTSARCGHCKNPAATMVPCRGGDSRMLQCDTCDAPPVHRDVHGASNIRELMAHYIRTRSRPAYLSGPAVARFTSPGDPLVAEDDSESDDTDDSDYVDDEEEEDDDDFDYDHDFSEDGSEYEGESDESSA